MNYREYFALEKELKAAGYDLSRQEIVGLHTEGKHTSLRELNVSTYYSLLNAMRAKMIELEDPTMRRMRRKIISRMRLMGYEKGGKADMKAIYSWVIKYGVHHKPLNSHSNTELINLTTQVTYMYDKYIEFVHKN